jgi:hypothetical protein
MVLKCLAWDFYLIWLEMGAWQERQKTLFSAKKQLKSIFISGR